MDPNQKYYLFLCDLKASTQQSPGQAAVTMDAVETAIDTLNRGLKPRAVRKLQVSYGDEVAGLFRDPHQLYDVVSVLRDALYPVRFRWVVSYGTIGTADRDIRKIGGPIFKSANDAMQDLKRQGRYCKWLIDDALAAATLEALADMSHVLVEAMTGYQYEVYQLVKSGLNQKQIAEHLGKFAQSVSDAVKRGHIEQVLDAEDVIRRQLAVI